MTASALVIHHKAPFYGRPGVDFSAWTNCTIGEMKQGPFREKGLLE